MSWIKIPNTVEISVNMESGDIMVVAPGRDRGFVNINPGAILEARTERGDVFPLEALIIDAVAGSLKETLDLVSDP